MQEDIALNEECSPIAGQGCKKQKSEEHELKDEGGLANQHIVEVFVSEGIIALDQTREDADRAPSPATNALCESPPLGKSLQASWTDLLRRRLNHGGSKPDFGRAQTSTSLRSSHSAQLKSMDELMFSAWQRCQPDLFVFISSFFFEMFPTPIGTLLCSLTESLDSARNRGLFWHRQSFIHPFNNPLVLDLAWNSAPWIMLAIWLGARPHDVSADVVAFPFLMLTWRAGAIGVKYAYQARSDMQAMRSSDNWRKSFYNFRILGVGQHFDTLGTIYYDLLEELLDTSLRAGVLRHIKGRTVKLKERGAETVWRVVKPLLDSIGDANVVAKRALFPGGSAYGAQGRYTKTLQYLNIADIDAIDNVIASNEVPLVVFAYYMIVKSFRNSSRLLMACGCLMAFSCGGISPIVRFCMGHKPFGDSTAAQVILGYRVFNIAFSFMPSMLFCIFPVMDAYKRMKMSRELLLICGDPVTLAMQASSVDKTSRILLDTTTGEDIKNIVLLTQLLGPLLGRGQMMRYGSGIVSLGVLLVVISTAILYIQKVLLGKAIEVGTLIEVMVFFTTHTLALLLTTTLYARAVGFWERIPSTWRRFAWLAAIENEVVDEDLRSVMEVVDEVFESNMALYPIVVLYQPASYGVLSLVWSFSWVLVAVWCTIIGVPTYVEDAVGEVN